MRDLKECETPDVPGTDSRHMGHLLLVTCADIGRLDLLLPAAARLSHAETRASLVEPVTTRMLPAGGGILLRPNGLDELEKLGALALSWRHGRHVAGFPVSIVARLMTGENVVAGAPQSLEPEARKIWSNMSVIRLVSGTEKLRRRLTRFTGRETSVDIPADALVEDGHHIGNAVRRLANAMSERCRSRAVPGNDQRHAGRDSEAPPPVSASTAKATSRSVLFARSGIDRGATLHKGASSL